MTTLSAARTRGYTNSQTNAFPISTSTTIWGGAAVGLNPTTRLGDRMQPGYLFVGFAKSSVNHIPGQQRDNFVTVIDCGQVVLAVSGAVQADVGKDVYATDDDTFVLTSSGGSFVGVAKQLVSSGKLLVEIAPPSMLNALRLSADRTAVVSGDGTVIEIGGGGGSSTFAGLSDKTSVDIPATNTPTANALALKAPLASPTFTGTPAAPTAAKGTNTTQVATTAFVIERTGGASAVVDAIDLTLTSSHADTNRAPSGALTYTVNASTGWAVGEGMVVWLPTSGVLTFAVSGGPTINGGTSSITRALLDNAGGYVVLSRIQGSSAYAVTGF